MTGGLDARLTLAAIMDYNADSQNAGAFTGLIEFDGPPFGKCNGIPYISFNQWGPREQGQNNAPSWDAKCWTEAEAVFRFRHAFFAHLLANPAKYLAWRYRPELAQDVNGDWKVYARFVLLDEV